MLIAVLSHIIFLLTLSAVSASGQTPAGAMTPIDAGRAYFGRYQVSAAGDAITHFVETSLKPNEVGVAYQRAIRIEGGRLFISLQAEEDGVSRHRVLTWRRAEQKVFVPVMTEFLRRH